MSSSVEPSMSIDSKIIIYIIKSWSTETVGNLPIMSIEKYSVRYSVYKNTAEHFWTDHVLTTTE